MDRWRERLVGVGQALRGAIANQMAIPKDVGVGRDAADRER